MSLADHHTYIQKRFQRCSFGKQKLGEFEGIVFRTLEKHFRFRTRSFFAVEQSLGFRMQRNDIVFRVIQALAPPSFTTVTGTAVSTLKLVSGHSPEEQTSTSRFWISSVYNGVSNCWPQTLQLRQIDLVHTSRASRIDRNVFLVTSNDVFSRLESIPAIYDDTRAVFFENSTKIKDGRPYPRPERNEPPQAEKSEILTLCFSY